LSGPTGSGKTTTLYAGLRHLRKNCTDLHLVSIEDPVEKPIQGVTQIKIDADGERLTFNKALRSVLRHDPDVIMIGEIRDGETGDIAVKSSLTGHLVLSTLHTNSAAGVLTRLINIGIAPFLVASTLRLAIAQRLVRVPCQHCAEKRNPSEEECMEFGWDFADKSLQIPVPKGCSLCGDKGYLGRVGLYEIIPIDNTLRKMILKNTDETDFENYAFNEKKLPSLHTDGAAKILLGKTTIQEVRDVTNTNF
ncbi:MAG: GspE/PulE family protein, partial [Lentisphaeria bacterium]